jgi:four helix bundle protein
MRTTVKPFAHNLATTFHKISICEKEAAETEYWLELFLESNVAPAASFSRLLTEIRELLAIFVASGKTAKSHR